MRIRLAGFSRWLTTAAGLTLALLSGCAKPQKEPSLAGEQFRVALEYHKLDNGLRVVLSPEHSVPTVTLALYYNIGFRIEPRGRTGFAHLFEHMMFQGSQNLGKMEFIRLVQSNGGILNGSTRFDYTNYFEILPAHKLETALWAEADRMKGLAITQENLTNQQGVVKNEVKVNVLNQPYGGFPWLDLPQLANQNWYNSHNFYGDLADIDAATLEDVQAFFKTYYAPNNAALVLCGDFEPGEGLALVRRYFGGIPASELPPQPDLTEPVQQQEKKVSRVDSLANRPALAFAYHMPAKHTPEYYAMGLLDQMLVQGEDCLLHKALVKQRGMTGSVEGGINFALGNMLDYQGPILWTAALFHDSDVPADSIMAEVDRVIDQLCAQPPEQAALERALVKFRSGFYDFLEDYYGFGLADLLACFALFDDDPGRINQLEEHFRAVTPGLILKTAREYLRPTNRTVLSLVPKNES